MYAYVYVLKVSCVPGETQELAASVLVRISMEEAGRPKEAAIAERKTKHCVY